MVLIIAHVAVWQLYDLHDLAHASMVEPVLFIYRPCTTSQNGSYRIYLIDNLDRDLSDVDDLDRHLAEV